MRRFIPLFIILLIVNVLYANSPEKANASAVATSDLNGMYESVVDLQPNWSKSKKSLVRFHLFIYDFKANYPVKIDENTQQKVFAHPVLVYKEVFYQDKKAAKAPQREFFSGHAYIFDNVVEIHSNPGKNGAKDVLEADAEKGYINTGVFELCRLDRFVKVADLQSGEVEIPLNGAVRGVFTKKSTYEELPAIFSPYLELAIRQHQNALGNYIMARNGYKSYSTYLYAQNASWSDSLVDVYVRNRSWEYGKKNPSVDFIKYIENELLSTAGNVNTGLASELMYFPRLKTLRVHMDATDDDNSSNILNLNIECLAGDLEYAAEYTEAGKALIQKATQADEQRALAK
ncbi:hypothetical protein [Mangrovibacterium diazotrophicum]|uniref:Uncharacterized protein n=1 Tax=Mangrovibacterium diazotrophicum TaxID=1261403 RepID=A0A419W326_9BACT|nr:hypothetical protein [Mangrovibacterium diazotrophicum]RKD89863.1 hypothetical protein BC643_0197 [Mangrovibacterium diazotrophicum]